MPEVGHLFHMEHLNSRSTVSNVTVEHMDGHMSLRVIATTVGVSATTVMRDLRKVDPDSPDGRIHVGKTMGIDGKLRPDRRFDTTTRDTDIRTRRATGETVRQIASAVGCSVGTVHRVLKA